MINSLLVVDALDGRLVNSDRAAVGWAIREFGNSVKVCSPSNNENSLRYALAAGVPTVVSLNDCLADVYLVGAGGAGAGGDLMVARLANERNANLVLEVLEFHRQGSGIEVLRDLGRGAKEVLQLSFPCVLLMSELAASPNYVSRYRQQCAVVPNRRIDRPADREQVPAKSDWQPLRPRTKTAEFAKKTLGEAKSRMFEAFGIAEVAAAEIANESIIQAEPDVCAEHLLRYLAHHGFINFPLAAATVAVVDGSSASLGSPELVLATVASENRIPFPGRQPALPVTQSRSPRPLHGPQPGIHRRPRPYRAVPLPVTKLIRGPRPVGQPIPQNIRGPFPLN